MEEMLVITIGLSPAESGCLKPWAADFLQDDRTMVFTGKGTAKEPDQYVLIAAVTEALAWERPREKTSESRITADRTFICSMEVSDFMGLIKTGKHHNLPEGPEQIGAVTESVYAARAQLAELRLYSYEDALPKGSDDAQLDPARPDCSPGLPSVRPGKRSRTSQGIRSSR
jgi:hypothetical protein